MPLPAFADAYLRALRSDDAAVLLATINHPSWGTIRLVKNTADVVSRGDTFKRSWFTVDLPTDNDQVPKCTFLIPNVTNPVDGFNIGQAVLRIIDAPIVALEVVALSHPDEPIMRVARLELRNFQVGPINVSGELWGKDYSSEPFGTIVVTPARFPALFRARG